MNQQPIGVFDSGVGGLTTLRPLEGLLPGERFLYFGDTARMPYGPLPNETIVRYARQDAAFLSTFDPKAVVIACGTITTAALEPLRQTLSIPVLGVVEGACRRAAAAARCGRIGLLATEASVRSGAYEQILHTLDASLSLVSQPCPDLAPLAEAGHTAPGDPLAEAAAAAYTRPLSQAGVDTVILGCTHYSLLRDVLAACLGPQVTLIDAAAAAAEDLAQLLRDRRLLAQGGRGSTRLFVSADAAAFEALASRFLGRDVTGQAEQIDIERY